MEPTPGSTEDVAGGGNEAALASSFSASFSKNVTASELPCVLPTTSHLSPSHSDPVPCLLPEGQKFQGSLFLVI